MSWEIKLALVKGGKGFLSKSHLPCGRQYPSSAMTGCDCLKVVVNNLRYPVMYMTSLMDRWDTFRLSPAIWWCNTISGPSTSIHCCSTEPFLLKECIVLSRKYTSYAALEWSLWMTYKSSLELVFKTVFDLEAVLGISSRSKCPNAVQNQVSKLYSLENLVSI